MMDIRCATYIRTSTVRPSIRYIVSWCKSWEGQVTAVAMCRRQQGRLKNGLKGIVYCNSKEEKGGFITATSALGMGVDFPSVVFIMHVGVPWSMIDYAQESGRGGRAGEATDSVIIVEEGAVEQRIANSNGSADVHAIGHFIQISGCRRGAMSEYLDGNRVECGDIDLTGCDRCGEGLAEWQESNSRWGWEWDRVQIILDELTRGYVVCWVVGESMLLVESDFWASYDTRDCRSYKGMTDSELKKFRGSI
ncbi:uncharacterized protein PV09_09460 [Verruconis gallopava]|uniref:DNA 3'-5' helicase n=1 Tax=Verruconis gallopava TaxID=253628 RepID=A0A0D1ZW91_9PEZI|nr:uncharacterized protein PV09_09490 [Verruconis gallopava]XP_016208632.1 uncharacterized protein PV09_09460 [Verruconis gallopava]KIV98738.1 hypothetical protein PV09_09490 [Verruconis gallopava]KIV98762.1 hypothetical protein PV09_09460 [Verruconis gallopava]